MNLEEIKGSKILIVDDNPGNLGVLFDYLSKLEFIILLAQSGEDALELVEENLPDIILLDILMPGIDGFETCRKLKSQKKTRDIPVLFISSLSEVFDKVKSFEAGGVDYITKPFQQEEVLARIKTHLNIIKLKTRLEKQNKDLQEQIEERKKAEKEAYLAKEEAESANRAKSAFLANMSHEIRTPMNAIMGFTDILDQKIIDNDQKKYLSLIRAGGNSLISLINDILDLSKIEAGKLELEYRASDICAVFEEIVNIFSHKVKEKKLELILDADPNLQVPLIFDKTRIRQILFNLVGNAIKFTEKGYIKIAAKGQNLDKKRNIMDIMISVEDTGIGIPKDQENLIFRPFEQCKGQCSSKYGGTGLGLAITKRLVKIMGGSISLKSREGRGSRFIVCIKNINIADHFDFSIENKADKSEIIFKNALIMIADDYEDNRILVKEYLSEFDLNYIEAKNGREAVEIAKSHLPDIILMDIKMPGMNGQEATRIIKADNLTKDIPIVAVTALAMKNSEKELNNLCDGYLKKPVKKGDLIFELSKFLDHSIKDSLVNSSSQEKLQNNSDHEFQPDVLENMSELKAILESKLEICNEIAEILTINDIDDFANQMLDLGTRYKYKPLLQWSDRLLSQTMMFDMEAIPETLGEFSKIVKQVQDLI